MARNVIIVYPEDQVGLRFTAVGYVTPRQQGVKLRLQREGVTLYDNEDATLNPATGRWEKSYVLTNDGGHALFATHDGHPEIAHSVSFTVVNTLPESPPPRPAFMAKSAKPVAMAKTAVKSNTKAKPKAAAKTKAKPKAKPKPKAKKKTR